MALGRVGAGYGRAAAALRGSREGEGQREEKMLRTRLSKHGKTGYEAMEKNG